MRTLLAVSALFLMTLLLVAHPAVAQAQQGQLNLMPMPSTVHLGVGQLSIRQSFSVEVTGVHDATLDRGVQRFLARLSQQTGMLLKRKTGEAPSPALVIHAERGRSAVQTWDEDESYELTVADSGAKLSAPNSLGILHGLETFLQLVEPSGNGFAVPAVTIQDAPRFPWRGTLIDVSRHFLPLDVLKRNLDGMAAVKMNVLHLHISDNEGFRIESKRLPKLHEMGSEGLYFTQDQMRELLAYARDRGIRVVPEFDMPGHSRSWFPGYPELASAPGPYRIEPSDIDPVMDPTQEGTYKFLDKFIGEMAALFPDAYFHIGGDEVNPKQWNENPKIQSFIHSHGMKNDQDLQAYFNQRLLKIVNKHRKNMIGWDEILRPDLPKTIVVQSWRGQESLAAAAKQGYSGMLSFGYYLDLMWPAARHYAVDPMSGAAATLSSEDKKRILGGESCMWSEWVTPENVDSHIWPRNAVIAERLWSSADIQDVDSMYRRLGELSWRLEGLGLTHRSSKIHMLRRMAGVDDISALRVLADVVEPGKDYTRGETLKGPRDGDDPLNRLVDAVSPESDAARRFAALVQAYIQSGHQDRAAEAQIRAALTAWRDNDAKLQPLLQQSFLLREASPLSADLSSLGTNGLSALDYLDRSELSPEAWRKQQLALVERAKTAKANLLLMVAGPVQQLVEASGGQGVKP
jgi:hexosaminidase